MPVKLFSYFLMCALTIASLASCKIKRSGSTSTINIDSLPIINKNPLVTYDQSPMDMSYYPAEFPVMKMNKQDTLSPVARVIYSRPHKKNREIFSDAPMSVCQYGKEWRLGANEATELDLYRNITIAGKNVTQGRYVIYCIPHADHWTIVLNTNLDTWGLHMDPSKDVLRTDVPVTSITPAIEDFTMVFKDADDGANLVMAWDTVTATLPLTFSK